MERTRPVQYGCVWVIANKLKPTSTEEHRNRQRLCPLSPTSNIVFAVRKLSQWADSDLPQIIESRFGGSEQGRAMYEVWGGVAVRRALGSGAHR